MMTRHHRSLVLVGVLAVSGRVASAQMMAVEWDGEAGDMLWNSASNWSMDALPGEMDAVSLSAAGSVVTAQSIPINVRSLDVPNGLFNNNGSLRVAEASRITDYTIDGCCVQNKIANGPLLIDGFSDFLQRPIFMGTDDVTIDGEATFGFGFIAQGRELRLDGTGIAIESQGRADSLVSVRGRVELLPTGSASSTVNGQWSILGGSIGVPDQEDINPPAISALLDLQGGTIFSEGGRLVVSSSNYTLDDLVVEVSNGGRVFFQGGAQTADFNGATFRGQGEVWLDTSNIRIRQPATNEISSFGTGLRLDASIDLSGTLTNVGRMTMRNATIRGAGGITTSGSAEVIGGLVQDAPLRVTGGTFDAFGGINSAEPMELSGGELRLHTGSAINLAQNSEGRVTISGGTLLVPSTNAMGDNIQIFAPTDLTGGVVRVERGTLQYRGPGGAWSAATVQLGGTGPTDQPTFSVTGPPSPAIEVASLTVEGSGFAVFGSGTSSSRPEVSVQGTIDASVSEGNFIVGTTFSGPGTLTNNANMNVADSPARLACNTVNKGKLLFSSGTVASTLTNAGAVEQRGTLSFDGGGVLNTNDWRTLGGTSSQLVGAGSFTNAATYRAQLSFGASHSINIPFNNLGVLIADGCTVFVNNTPQRLADGTLIGGSWQTDFGGRIRFPGAITTVRGPGTEIRGGGETWPEIEEIGRFEDETYVDLNGVTRFRNGIVYECGSTIELRPGASVEADGDIKSGDGSSLRLNEGSSVTTPGKLEVGTPPMPDGPPSVLDDIEFSFAPARGGSPTPPIVTASTFDLHGFLRPASGFIADMVFHADATSFETATWVFDADPGATPNADRYVGTGSLALGGTLELTFLAEPSFGDAFEIVRAEAPGMLAIAGSFDAIETVLPQGLRAMPVVLADSVEVRIVCAADLNADGNLSGADFNAFLTAFVAGDAAADQNADGNLTGADFNAFLTNFVAGCGGA